MKIYLFLSIFLLGIISFSGSSQGPRPSTSSGGGITGLTGDVSGSGTGSITTVVSSVGGYTAAAIASSVVKTQAATSSNTANTLVLRDSYGNFVANIITAAKVFGLNSPVSGWDAANKTYVDAVSSAKQDALTFTAPLVNTSNTVTCNAATSTQAGCMASADWTTFNAKQAAGNYPVMSSSGWRHDILHFGPKASGCSATTMPTTGCSTTPCDICQQVGNWASSVAFVSQGKYTINFNTAYSVAPICTLVPSNWAGSFANVPNCLQSAASTTSVNMDCYNSGGALNNVSGMVMCDGKQ